MKSKKAEEYIESIGGDEYYLCKYDYQVLIKTVEIAENEVKEKAKQVFCKTVCGGNNTDCESCTLIKSFIEFINE